MLFFKKKRSQEEQAFIDFLKRAIKRVGEAQKITTKHKREKNERGNYTQVIVFTFEDKELFFYKEFDGDTPVYFSINDPDLVTNYRHDREIDKLVRSIFFSMAARVLIWEEQKLEEKASKCREEILNTFK